MPRFLNAATKRNEAELTTDHINFRALLDALPDACFITSHDGIIREVNLETLALLGGMQEDWHGQKISDIILDGDGTGNTDHRFPISYLTSDSYSRFDAQLKNQDRDIIDVEITIQVLRQPDKSEDDFIWIIHDLSECKVVENHHDMLQNRSVLAEVQRMSLVGGIAAGLTHELAQPLAAIGGYAAGGIRRLKSGNASHGDLEILLQKINRQVDRAGNTLRLMCDFSQKQSDKPEFFDINALVEETCHILKHELRIKNVRITHKLSDGLPKIRGEKTQIQQVLVNLIQNSVEEIDGNNLESGEITISSETLQSEELKISVMDNGPGFDSRLIANVFAPFFTRKQGSAGMGLTICETIIEGHDGRITIGSSSTGGAMVEFFLPVVSDSSELQ